MIASIRNENGTTTQIRDTSVTRIEFGNHGCISVWRSNADLQDTYHSTGKFTFVEITPSQP